jgi:hypothetical protein
MRKRAIKMFIATVMVVVLAMTLSPQTASAKDCKPYDYPNVTESEWQCLKNYVQSKGYSLSGDSGKVSKLGFGVKYNYDKEGKDLKFTTKALFSCSTIDGLMEGYVNEAMQQCRGRSLAPGSN